MSLEFVFKQPAEILDYDVDFTEWFLASPNDDIQTVSAFITGGSSDPEDLVVMDGVRAPSAFGVPPEAPPKFAKVWLEKGISGVSYKVTVRVDTEGGRRKEFDFEVRVVEN